MPKRARIPLHRLLLSHNKLRTVLSISGITFSVVVMFMEMGFFFGLNDSQTNLCTLINSDLVMISSRRTQLDKANKFYQATLYQAMGVRGVTEVVPIYEAVAPLKNDHTGKYNLIYVIAFPAGSKAFLIQGLPEQEDLLKNRNYILMDGLSRSIYGKPQVGDEADLNGFKYRLGGKFRLGPSFTKNGVILIGAKAWTANHYRGMGFRLSMGLIRTAPGVDVQAVKDAVAKMVSDDVVVLTPEGLRDREFNFMTFRTPVGVIFGMGLAIGFIIGIIICYQVLFNEINDNAEQYATLKAMGFSNGRIMTVIVKEALWIAFIGFVPGLLGGAALYWGLENMTNIVMIWRVERILGVLILTVLMCVIAALLAVKKVVDMDPADLY